MFTFHRGYVTFLSVLLFCLVNIEASSTAFAEIAAPAQSTRLPGQLPISKKICLEHLTTAPSMTDGVRLFDVVKKFKVYDKLDFVKTTDYNSQTAASLAKAGDVVMETFGSPYIVSGPVLDIKYNADTQQAIIQPTRSVFGVSIGYDNTTYRSSYQKNKITPISEYEGRNAFNATVTVHKVMDESWFISLFKAPSYDSPMPFNKKKTLSIRTTFRDANNIKLLVGSVLSLPIAYEKESHGRPTFERPIESVYHSYVTITRVVCAAYVDIEKKVIIKDISPE